MALTKTQYLYGVDVDTKIWGSMNYKDALELKAKLAWSRIEVLNSIHYTERDAANVTDCVNAIKFNENLIKEINEIRYRD